MGVNDVFRSGLIPHVFLPTQLPGHSKTIQQEESDILVLFNGAIQSFHQSTCPDQDFFPNTKNTFKLWETLQESIDPKPVSTAIRDLRAGETFALYLRAQNVGIMITIAPQSEESTCDDKYAIFSTFPASQPSDRVTKSEGDLAGVFPLTSVIVPKNRLLNSKCFGRQLQCLHVSEIFEAMPTTTKAGSTIAEVREVADPMFVTKWLTSVLCNENSKSSSHDLVPRVIKKVRDNVMFHEALMPFRRSGLWLTAKVVLQICLVQELGNVNGTFLYKMLLIHFMHSFLKDTKSMNTNWGVLTEMLGKVARRARKLQLYKKNVQEEIAQWLEVAYAQLMEKSAGLCKSIQKSMKIEWEICIENEEKLSEVFLRDLHCHVEHTLSKSKMPDLMAQLAKDIRFISVVKMVTPIPSVSPRFRNSMSKFDPAYFCTDEEHLGTVLFDFERNVRHWDSFIVPQDSQYVWWVFQSYLDKGRQFYGGDPVGLSRMSLTCLKIIQVWDKLVTRRYPTLLEHRPGLPMNFTEDLLVPHREDMLLLLVLEMYFQLREQAATFPSLIEEREVTIQSFGARFSSSNGAMQEAKKIILFHAEKRKEAKLLEVRAARKECESLLSRIRTIECEYVIDHWKRKHSDACHKCKLTGLEKNKFVTVYESPLPTGEAEQDAVMFELKIPNEIAVLRDLLYLFGTRMLSMLPSKTSAETGEHLSTELVGSWSQYKHIFHCQKREQNWKVDLRSTKKLVLQSHYKDLHPSNPDSDFIRKNGYNCHYASETTILGGKVNRVFVKNDCTLRVEKKTPYSSMQWAVEGLRCTPNEVLARQCECHDDLSLLEFSEFGGLRSGWKIQWRNIFRAFTLHTLSLKTSSVFNLLCQTIWQAGPPCKASNYFRSAHKDFEDVGFTREFLKLLEDIQKKHLDNWKDHHVLLTVIVLAQRISALSCHPEIQVMTTKILATCRQVASNWSNEIQRIVSQLTNAPRAEVDALRIKIVEVNLCCALTFRLDPSLVDEHLMVPPTIQLWLLSIAKIHDNLVLIGPGMKIPTNLRNLLRRVEETGIFLEPYLQNAFGTHYYCNSLNMFVRSHYTGSALVDLNPSWAPYTTYSREQIFFCEIHPKDNKSEMTTLQMDIIKGRFLVDGSPVGYLASAVENHLDFQRTFPTKSFEVQPYAYQPGRMMTRDKYLGSTYSFYMNDDASLLITEHMENGHKRELIPHGYFKGNVPSILVKNYTHWWNKNERTFEFFLREENYPSKLFEEKPTYFLEIVNNTLRDRIVPEKRMVDINSKGFRRILDIMERLEHYKYVNVWFCKGDQTHYDYVVDLPRLGLQFNFANPLGTVYLYSKEYRGMRVRQNQGLKTFVGLKNGLLIEDAGLPLAQRNAILLMPHGTVVVRDSTPREVRIICESPLRQPSFFAYEVDTRLKQLRAGESQAGWVYLAYLHAITASPLVDPFTGVTGTERAIQLLQSGHCWSCQPLDEETLKTLKHISQLSPNREYYPPCLKKMESVSWPLLPAQVSHDAFQLIVEKLLEDSERMAFLFRKGIEGGGGGEGAAAAEEFHEEVAQSMLRSDRNLRLRGYWRRIGLSTEQARISPNFSEEFEIAPKCTPIHLFDFNFKTDQMKNVLLIGQLCHKWTCCPPMYSAGLLKSLLLNGKDLKGVFEEGYPIKEEIYSWSREKFRDNWLDLYILARRVKKKKLEAEWTYLLTFFAFREDEVVDMDQLHLLHTVAVHPENFWDIDPPDCEVYFQTDQFALDAEIIEQILMGECTTKWEDYCDAHFEEEMRLEENQEEFAARMRPIHEELVQTQCSYIVDKIKEKWPLECCQDIFDELKDDEKSELLCQEAVSQLNIFLKNWVRNQKLYVFTRWVEETIAMLVRSKEISVDTSFVDTRKYLVRLHQKGNLEEFCLKEKFTIDLKTILGERNEMHINNKLYEDAKAIFHFNAFTPTTTATDRNVKLPPENNNNNNKNRTTPKFPLQLKEVCPILKEYMGDLQDSWKQFHENTQNLDPTIQHSFVTSQRLLRDYKDIRSQTLDFWEKVKEALWPRDPSSQDEVTKQLVFSELFPRIVPLNLLPLLKETTTMCSSPFLNYLWTLLGAYGVLLTLEQKAARCVRYSQKGKSFQGFELQKEISHVGHENWNPAQRPNWLLFEIEMDLMVRPVQATVAERMENPEKNQNALIQLNMGEGKTSVIVPLLVLSLADGRQLCRVTVLKSLYRINHTALVYRIGGLLLNRRVYTFPCRRDNKILTENADKILDVYQECAEKHGVVMTLPEYRLSFELKAFEKCQAKSFVDGRKLFEVQDWLRQNARDVLDESDEILHVKYQLIYTLGKQMPIGGGSLRWTVLQGLLRLVPTQIETMLKLYDSSYLEFKRRGQPFKFPYCRILKPDCSSELSLRLACEVLNGNSKIQIPEVNSARKEMLMEFLTKQQIDRKTFNEIFKLYPIQAHQEVLLILRGFLACGVLCTALNKRWRVNYGVNPSGYRRMAVPFRAKDVAAERTEFGHPDVAIVLTELSYYYSGLNDEQLEQCFVILFLTPNPDQEYERWIGLVPRSYKGYFSIRLLSGVNLKDFSQRTNILFPALRKNVNVIDFWLSHLVFPHESKQFGFKIGCSPWDLCLDENNRRNPTTGFSGTNDSKLLLPKTIFQKDLAELQGTNGEVLKNLLLPENNEYEPLALGFTGRQILEKLVDQHIRLLLDVGALMLELNNEQVAYQWLRLENDNVVDAAVYFDEHNKLVVVDRSGNAPVSLEISTFRTRLDRCVIYLDDVHTRGTDLKIPPNTRGCVTLGKGVTKDKLVQGCMRMRMLGQRPGHQVLFWASQEVHNAIQQMVLVNNDPKMSIETKHVLQWSIMNNRDSITEGFIHWASAGVYQAQKLSAQAIYNCSSRKDPDLLLLAESCAQKEQVDLKAMYGDVRTLQKFPTIVQHLLNRVQRELAKRLDRSRNNTSLVDNVNVIVQFFGNSVKEHTEKYVAELLRSTQLLDEEQERELEHEMEAQHQKQKPGRAKSHDHNTSPGVIQFIRSGVLQGIDNWAMQVPLALQQTILWSLCPNDTWAPSTYASRDFSQVIRSTSKMDRTDFLRPPNWLCSVTLEEDERKRRGRKTVFLLLSPFEADYFMDLFRSGEAKALLHMYAPRLSLEQDTLYKNVALALPPLRGYFNSDNFPAAVNSALLLFSGSCYFANKEEQDQYCRFVGFCPRPRNYEENLAFEADGLVDGFVKEEFRLKLGYGDCAFAKNPEQMIRRIVEIRYGSFSMDSHVGKIAFQCIKPFK